MAAQTIAKGLGIFGISPAVVEVFFADHEEQVMKAKFADHLATQGLSFDTDEEYNFRLQIFVEKDQEINGWNAKQDSFRLAHNHLSTKTGDEINKMKGLASAPGNHEDATKLLGASSSYVNTVDWVTAGYVNAVQNQGSCGSCWAFSATAAIESQHALATGELLKLSEQQFVDCDHEPGANGCNGGNYGPAFAYAMNNSIVLGTDYPYTGTAGTCNTAMAANGQVSLKNHYGWSSQPTSTSIPLAKQVLEQIGPYGIAVEAAGTVFQHFASGIIDTTSCGRNLDHAVLAVGWGTYQGTEYLLVRNSWGTGYGVDGYVYIAMNDQDICGALTIGNFPQVTNAQWTI